MEKKTLTQIKKTKVDEVTSQIKQYKDTAVKEFKETRLLVKLIISAAKQYLKNKTIVLDDEEKQFIKDQSKDVLKLIPLIVIQIFPGSTLATPFLVMLGKKLGIKLTSVLPEKHKEVEKQSGEIEELVGADGSFSGSFTPIVQQNMTPHKTTDQTVRMTRVSQFPFVRVYYGESEEKEGTILDEEDMSGAFGDEETENDKTYKECMETMEQLGVDDFVERDERCKTFGFDKTLDKQLINQKKNGQCKNCFTKKRLTELEKEKMVSMIDEILLSKKKKDSDIVDKEDKNENNPIEKILVRNLQSVKKIADKEGININNLFKKLKNNEQ